MSTTTVQEVILNADLQKQPTKAGVNGNVNLVRLNGDASKLNGTDKKSKISTTIEDCKSKAKEFLSNVPEVTPAVKDTALKTLYVVIASFVLFFLIVAYRVGRSFYTVEDTYVCNILGYVDGMAHSTLAPELCTRYHDDLYTEFGNEGARLAGEIHDGVGNVFTNIADGMKVMYDVSSTVSAHYYNLLTGSH